MDSRPLQHPSQLADSKASDHAVAIHYGDVSPEACRQLELALSGRYTIQRAIGRGGMATVYLAVDTRYHRQVAIKIMHPALARELGVERFLREIGIVARLQHPHIVPLHDSGEAAGLVYFVMPYVEGESLRERLARERQLPMNTVLAITRDVADALDFAHSQGVVHRDIKPGNVLLNGSTSLIADFGIACAIQPDESERITSSGLVIGTPAYMSPEQASGGLPSDPRSDLYALGCVVYEMVAGEPPFDGPTAQAVFAKHRHTSVPDLRVVRPTVTPAMQQVIETALAKVPADRFGTAGEFATALAASVARPVASRRPWRAAVVGGVVLVASIAGLLARRSRPASDDRPVAAGVVSTPPRIAVLYFDDLTADSTLQYVADGLTEELIHELSGVNGFRVISKNGVRPYRGRRVPFDSMATALRVNTMVDGSVQRLGDQLRVRAQLIDARSDTYVDSLSLEVPIADPRSLQAAALEVAAVLRRQMGRDVRLRSAGLGTDKEPARALAFRAQRAREDAMAMAQRMRPEDLGTAKKALARADSLLVLAQAADRRWLRPLIERGWIAYELARLLSGEARLHVIRQAIPLAEEAVRRAPTSAEALELRGTLGFLAVAESQESTTDPDRPRKIEADLRAALERDSTLARAWATLSDLLWFKGNTAEASLAADRALREDVYLTDALHIYTQLFFNDLMLGEFGQAAEWCRRGRLTFPNHWRFVECELTLLRHDVDAKPDPARAWALVKELDRLDPADKAKGEGRQYHTIYRRIVAATISARAGRHDIARAEIARARRATEGDSVLAMDLGYDEAYLRLVLGERGRAEELLRAYIKARPMARDYLARDPLLRGLNLTTSNSNTP